MWRLFRISLLSAFVLSLPFLLVSGYYGYRAVAAHYRYNAAIGQEEQLTAELFHLHLHDLLQQDVRRLAMPDGPKDSDLPTLNLMLGNGELAELDRNLPPEEGKGAYVSGYLQKGQRIYSVKARYRGRRHWHWNYPQKSWKIRLQEGQFFEGRDTIGLLNTVSPMPFSQQIILDIAREEGLLTPDYYPVRLQLNNAPMGVHFLQTQPDEGLIRNSRRIPGGLFSGSKAPIDDKTGVSSLWQDVSNWKKVATSQTEKLKDYHRLEELLVVVNSGDQEKFSIFAERHLDLERFALLDALDVIFGNDQHDFHQDHKLYFDPYRARFEPIAWGFGRWRNPNRLNRTDNPLLLRLKELPEYRTRRNRTVQRLLDGPCSPTAIRERAEGLFATLRGDQLTDPFWDAYRLLPGLGRYYRQMVRPMDVERQAIVFETIMRRYGRRVARVLEKLERPGLSAAWQLAGEGRWRATLDVTIDGHSGYRLDSVQAHAADCREPAWRYRPDRNLSGRPEGSEPLLIDHRPMLEPGNVLEARGRVNPERGAVRAVARPQRYRFFVEGDCTPESLTVIATHGISGEAVRLEAAPEKLDATPFACETAYSMAPEQLARHPWCTPLAAKETVELGPGKVKVKKDREYGPNTTVRIRPGTTLILGKRVSLVFRGRVLAEGTADDPIVLTKKKKRYGGVVLQGPGTSGSRFRHVRFEKGRHPKWGMGVYPGLLNIHDTSDILLEHCEFGPNRGADDVLHVAYVNELAMEEVMFERSLSDALDIEFSEGTLAGIVVNGAGDECLDLMGSRLNVRDSRFTDCGGSAVSAGEGSKVNLVDSYLGGGTVGLLVKNASKALVDGVLFHNLGVAVQVEVESDRYEKRSKLRGDVLLVLDCEQALVSDKRIKKQPVVRVPDVAEVDGLPAMVRP